MLDPQWISKIRRDLDARTQLGEQDFLTLLPDCGLLFAVNGEPLPELFQTYVLGLTQSTEEGFTRLDRLLHQALAEVSHLLEYGVSEDSALAFAELQQWSMAIPLLNRECPLHPSVFQELDHLCHMANSIPLDDSAVQALEKWKKTRNLPEEFLIPAIDTILHQDELNLLALPDLLSWQRDVFKESIPEESTSDTRREEPIYGSSMPAGIISMDLAQADFPNETETPAEQLAPVSDDPIVHLFAQPQALAADAEGEAGRKLTLQNESGKSIGELFDNGEGVYTVALTIPAIQVRLDSEVLNKVTDVENVWDLNWTGSEPPNYLSVVHQDSTSQTPCVFRIHLR
ncbi:MAG: hypothetical protein P8K66_11050 [Planctomycetota bacterium]|nr:hypothetical protein [Planctomycetota bacterium]